MEINLKKLAAMLCLAGSTAAVHAGVCNIIPGSVTCGRGAVDHLTANGMVNVNGTTILGAAMIDGLLQAEEASFHSLDVNGSVKLTQCTISHGARIKGALTASSSRFEKALDVYSSETRLINTKVSRNLHLRHTDAKKQVVYLDNNSEVLGDVIFDDGDGEVVLTGESKIGGKIMGGQIVSKE